MNKKIIVYSTDYCPYCTRAKSLLTSKNVDFDEIDVTNDDDLRMEMVRKSGGRKTVPQIFIDDIHIGGFDDLHALDIKGELDKLLK
jgi:glutaredoxin 3